MKTIFKVFLISILAIFLILWVTPLLMKGKIIKTAKKEMNSRLPVKVDFADLKISLVRNFPNVYVALDDLTAIGTGDSEGDTLLTFKKLNATVYIGSLIRMSRIHQNNEDFRADGKLTLSGLEYKSPDFPQGVKIASLQLNVTPEKVDLVIPDATVGRSDVAINGSFENVIPYIFKGDTVRGQITLKSNIVDLSEFLPEEAEENGETGETGEAGKAGKTVRSEGNGENGGNGENERPDKPASRKDTKLPENIHFEINAKIGRMTLNNMTLTNPDVELLIKDGKVKMQKFRTNSNSGEN